ncbi:MAG: hypothetical protein KBT04_03145 [Bacteroidales bacterium]|nr:hypothetical protein [Candidatus Colimorpha onthohippi]
MKLLFCILFVLFFVGRGASVCAQSSQTVPNGNNGALAGLFSVAEGRQVRFSKGNLQYSTKGTHACADGTTKPGTWRFAEYQYSYVGSASQVSYYNDKPSGNVPGSDNANIGSSYEGWIDLFGWGTSGYNGCEPFWSTMAELRYGPAGEYNLTDTNANYDWGVYNAISNGGDVPNKWRVLTMDEWEYMCSGRVYAASKWGYATVNGVQGVVFLPDNWTLPTSCTFTSGCESGWTTNSYTDSQWVALETAGAVFLPAAGYRYGVQLNIDNPDGYYWSSTAYFNKYASRLDFNSSQLRTNYSSFRSYGYSVRLVCE